MFNFKKNIELKAIKLFCFTNTWVPNQLKVRKKKNEQKLN